MLEFSKGNNKIPNTLIFDLPAGWTCPAAKDCKVRADRSSGKLRRSSGNLYDCYAASQEAVYSGARDKRWRNFEALRGLSSFEMFDIINASLAASAAGQTRVRIHSSGDFFNRSYFLAWVEVAKANPGLLFYAYTKQLPFMVDFLNTGGASNLKLTASRGGRYDALIDLHGLKEAVVVYTVTDAERLGLPIDVDDSLAWSQDESFALLIHGVQEKGTERGRAAFANRQVIKDLKILKGAA